MSRSTCPLNSQLVRSVGAGGLSTAAHWTVMAVLVGAGVDAILSTAIGALAGAGCNYWLQFKFAFRSKLPHTQSLPAFTVVAVVSWLANTALFALLINTVLPHDATAQFVTTAAITAMNFLLYKKVVFNEHDSRTMACRRL